MSVLGTRLNLIVSRYIYQEQTGFIKDGLLRDNVRSVINIIDHMHKTRVPTVL